MTTRIDLPPFPNGWFAVAFSDDLAPGDVASRHYFGRDLVLYRTQGGAVHTLDAHCPHVGAHLGVGGSVKGDNIVCPFHGWRFDGSGRCVQMPYGSRIPVTAKTKSWPTREKNGIVLVYHHDCDEAPSWEMPDFDDSHWTPYDYELRKVKTHPQEVLENTADFAHFRYVHGGHMVKAVEGPVTEGPLFRVRIESDPTALIEEDRYAGDHIMRQEAMSWGPGLAMAITKIDTPAGTVDSHQRLFVTPIDGEYSDMRGICSMEKLDDEQLSNSIAQALNKSVFEQWDNDIPIWENKLYRPKPALNDQDGPFVLYRRWYQQFFPEAP